MQEKLMVLCPTRGRPKQCLEMVNSFLETQSNSVLKLMLDMDDPCLDEYRETVGAKVSYTIDFRKPITQLINEAWGSYNKCYRFFSVTNDDFVYRTPEWDKKLISTINLHGGIGIAYGNDLLQGANMPTCSIISREIPEALGWLQMPTLTHLFGDTVWQTIGLNAKCLHYHAHVIIEHKHFFAHKAAQDDTYQRSNSKAMYDIDTVAYMKWHTQNAKIDIDKIKVLVGKNTRQD